MTLAEKLASLPTQPGCYIYRDENNKILYVGKAKNLRNRVRQYFHSYRSHDAKTNELVSRIADFDLFVTDNEIEALALECNLIKKHKPPFNVLLKDDKQYPHIKITNEPAPRAIIARKIIKDGSRYYGPYLPPSLAWHTLDLINRYFQLRTCTMEIDGKADRPCLEYHIKRCLGPCVKELCSIPHYDEAVRDVELLLQGKTADLTEALQERMQRASEELRFEAAARYRDQLKTIEKLGEQQKMLTVSGEDIDIFGYYREGHQLALSLFTMREGKVVGKREFFWEDIADPFEPGAFVGQALKQYYTAGDYAPGEVHVPVDFEDRELLEEYLTTQRGRRVHIVSPLRGIKRDLIDLVEKNARLNFDQRFRVQRPDMRKVLQELQEALGLPEIPERIESFDISNIQGDENVASMVVCEGGVMKKSDYRKFKVRSVEGQANDFQSMYEVVGRRYSRLLREDRPLPNLVLIDGGKGQLAAAARALHELGLEALPTASIAKREELLFVKGRDEPIRLDRSSPVLLLIQMIRDETHRFAVTYHRKRRAMRDFQSELTSIPGVGEKLKARLLRNFGSLKRVSEASFAELKPFVGERQARRIVDHFSDLRQIPAEPDVEEE
ncbi:MAG TPA: excinuclease ABC subunit UvrC [Blastocatellia bacterium]|jgi:excinuclease ABC subunit C|nr:excinuclease ABC subunit UvrC [Blastocatellia bacterium]